VRLRTASGLALAALAAAVGVMAVDDYRAAGITDTAALPDAVIVIEQHPAARAWNCPGTAADH
jgi:hypothetical protein